MSSDRHLQTGTGALRDSSKRRVEAALAGGLPVELLSDAEGAVFSAEVQARLEARLLGTDLGAGLAARGITTVALNERGDIAEYRPDGTSTVLASS